MNSDGWIGFDLDRTLAKGNSANWPEIGESTPLVEVAKKHIAEGREVRIITARVGGLHSDKIDVRVDAQKQHEIVTLWTLRTFGVELKVQAHKDYDLDYFYDDRAIEVEPNTGRLPLLEAEDEMFWWVPEAMPLVEKIKIAHGLEADALYRLALAQGRLKTILEYDEKNQLEGDAYANFESEQLHEGPTRFSNRHAIRVDGVTGDPADYFYVDPREARVLAAKLLKAADECDTAIAKGDAPAAETIVPAEPYYGSHGSGASDWEKGIR